mmetsp:Transcript_29872/g.76057  ORF Transcript_29872/g.76057 Transcript_29872/m.76057 type:complete len:237 (+) Transcript_29872:2233-2943(+)
MTTSACACWLGAGRSSGCCWPDAAQPAAWSAAAASRGGPASAASFCCDVPASARAAAEGAGAASLELAGAAPCLSAATGCALPVAGLLAGKLSSGRSGRPCSRSDTLGSCLTACDLLAAAAACRPAADTFPDPLPSGPCLNCSSSEAAAAAAAGEGSAPKSVGTRGSAMGAAAVLAAGVGPASLPLEVEVAREGALARPLSAEAGPPDCAASAACCVIFFRHASRSSMLEGVRALH